MIDLHLHSVFSDGSCTPEELVRQAVKAGLTAVALTDHDTTGGVARFQTAGAAQGMRCVAGVELSVDVARGTMHMLGYFVDPTAAPLQEVLRKTRDGRTIRNAEILGKLQALGMAITEADVAAHAGEEVTGRPHIAQALVSRGYVKTTKEAFDLYLAKGKPAYADRWRLEPAVSVSVLREAGGLAVLSHPFTLEQNAAGLRELVAQLAAQGLAGIEAYYPEHTDAQTRQYLRLADEFRLVATGGSDYHGTTIPGLAIGRGRGSLNVPDDVVDRLRGRL